MEGDINSRFAAAVSDLLGQPPANDEEARYQGVLMNVCNALDEGRISQLDTALRLAFPGYYDGSLPLLASDN